MSTTSSSPSSAADRPSAGGRAVVDALVERQGVEEIGPGACHPRADRADGHLAHLGGLRVREPDDLGEDEGGPPVRVERGDGTVELDLTGARGGHGVGSIGALRQATEQAASPGAPAHVVGADVAGDLQEPGASRGVATEPSEGGQGPEVHLLREVVGISAITQPGTKAPHLWLRATHEGGDRDAVATTRRQGQPGQIVHGESLVGGNQRQQLSDQPLMDCSPIREALSARLDDEDPGVDTGRIEAHLAGCTACTAFAGELGVLHRMTRVRTADEVPDLSAAILATTPPRAAASRSPLAEPISTTRWALFAVALTQLVLAAPALLLGEDGGATVHVARELGSFDVALAVGLLVAAWQPTRAWGLLPVVTALGLVMGGTAVLDVVDGSASTLGEAHHLLDLAGVALLWLVARTVRPVSEPLATRWTTA